jgi:hypothetical protein
MGHDHPSLHDVVKVGRYDANRAQGDQAKDLLYCLDCALDHICLEKEALALLPYLPF